jgi:hypothetical protein
VKVEKLIILPWFQLSTTYSPSDKYVKICILKAIKKPDYLLLPLSFFIYILTHDVYDVIQVAEIA